MKKETFVQRAKQLRFKFLAALVFTITVTHEDEVIVTTSSLLHGRFQCRRGLGESFWYVSIAVPELELKHEQINNES